MPTLRTLAAALLVAGLALGLTACDDDGPAEEAGEKVDEAVKDTKRAVDDAAD